MAEQQLPAPLVPPQVDLRDFAFMPLDVRRLRDSRLVAIKKPEEIVAAVMLWCASWHQQPASSLPDDDFELAQLAGYGRAVDRFRKLKAGALYGLIKCSDGRWYHPVVAEKAIDAWNEKLDHAYRREYDRIRKINKEREEAGQELLAIPVRADRISIVIPLEFQWNGAGNPEPQLSDSECKGTGKGQGRDREVDQRSVSGFVLDPLVDPSVWDDFQDHRCEIKKPLTYRARKTAAAFLARYSHEQQREIVNTTITSRWTGLFPPKGGGGQARPGKLARAAAAAKLHEANRR